MKTLIFRGSRAEILIEKRIKTFGCISPRDSKVLKIGCIYQSKFSGFEARIISEDYETTSYEIILRSQIITLENKQLTELIKSVKNFYPIKHKM